MGNARTFLVNWLLARRRGWRIILRIEDIDGPRIKHDADLQLIEDLRWLGLDWDDGPIYQSKRPKNYQSALKKPLDEAIAYPCVCSRREVELAASAPHLDDGAAVYPGTCRGRFASIEEARAACGREPALRFRVPDEAVTFEDGFSGTHSFDVQKLGDFVVSKADGTPAYQLAVVVDDTEMGVTQVVRGDDLLDSTPRQILLYRALGRVGQIPRYYHLPLIVGADGRRLAKRHGDTRLAYYRDLGVGADRVLRLLARWCGIPDPPAGVRAADLIESFRLESVPHQPIVFTGADDAWLLGKVA